MTDVFLDSTVFIDYHRGDAGAGRLFTSVFEGENVAFYSPVSVYELWSGATNRDEELQLLSLLAASSEVAFDSAHARQVAIWLARLTRQQKLSLAADAIIAATAASLNIRLYTRNPRDFTRFYPNVQSY